jgi:hypothetical protein
VLSDDRRRAIADFLRARRARLRPEQVGLPDGSRRRTPGLRREEVAMIARVSTEWYTRLEQGRDISESEALRSEAVTPLLQRLLDQLEYSPAWILGDRWDILAWNRAATVIFGDLAGMNAVERNALYQMFVTPRFRTMLVDWEMHARDIVGKVRLTHAARRRPVVQRDDPPGALTQRRVRAVVG